MKKFTFSRRSLKDLQNIRSCMDDNKYLGGYPWLEYHRYLIMHAVECYSSMQKKRRQPLGRVAAVCADFKEAVFLHEFPFDEILLTGITDPDERLLRVMSQDSRISYRKENCENLRLPSRSYDLVFCKEGLHHLARPVQGLYEMLRVCKRAAIIIEGYDCSLTRLLQTIHVASVYESNQEGNINARNNYVFRWGKSDLQRLLNSYYLDSGYHVHATLGWTSNQTSINRLRIIRSLGGCLGYAISYLPGCAGNTMTALITPGSNRPSDPIAINEESQNTRPTAA